jgi:hypothetical protein
MKAGRQWRSLGRGWALFAVLAGLGAGALRAAEKPEAAEPKAVKEKADEATAAKGKPAKLAFIDEMIREAWAEAKVKPSRLATDEEFLRRAYLDVIGRIPNIKEANAFLNSKEQGKRQKLISYLLQDPDYAKNLATQWTIVLIGRGRQERQVDREQLSSWLRREFNNERPWNEMVYDLITAKGSNKENGAANFTLAHLEFGAVPLTSITTRAFLGQQIQCTQCHDHPSNDWKQADFWGINAFFKGVRREDVMKETATGAEVYDHTLLSDEPTDAYASYDKRNGLVGIAFPRFLDGRKIAQGTEVSNRREELAKLVADPKNMDMARAFVNRTWGHFMGRGFVNPVDDFGAHNPASHPELLDKLAEEFQNSGYDVKALIRWITASEAYNLSSMMTKQNEKDETLFSHMALKPMTPEQLFDSLITATAAHKASGGDTTKKRDQWMGQFLFTFANDEGEEGSSFQGTIPQALMMMNGDLMEQAVSGKPGSFLNDLAAQAGKSRRGGVGMMVDGIFLASLTRHPTRAERAKAEGVLESNPDTAYVLEDLFWALLNSNEFILNH